MPAEPAAANKWPIPIVLLAIALSQALMGMSQQFMVRLFQPDNPLLLLISYAFSGIIVLLWLGWLSMHYFGSVKSGWGLQAPFKAKWLLMIGLATLGLCAFAWIYADITTVLKIELHPQEVVTMVSQTESQAEILPVFLIICGFGPIMEEIIYRACFYSAVKNQFGIFWGVFLSSLIFALMHMNMSSLMPLFMVGVMCAIIFERTKSLTASVIVHSLFNLVGLIFIYIGA